VSSLNVSATKMISSLKVRPHTAFQSSSFQSIAISARPHSLVLLYFVCRSFPMTRVFVSAAAVVAVVAAAVVAFAVGLLLLLL